MQLFLSKGNKNLWIFTVCYTMLTIIMVVILDISDPLFMERDILDDHHDYLYCTWRLYRSLHIPVVQSFRLSFICILSLLAYRARKISDSFNENRSFAFTIYNLSFLSMVLPTVEFIPGREKFISLVTYAATMYTICLMTILVIFLPKFLRIQNISNQKISTPSCRSTGKSTHSSSKKCNNTCQTS